MNATSVSYSYPIKQETKQRKHAFKSINNHPPLKNNILLNQNLKTRNPKALTPHRGHGEACRLQLAEDLSFTSSQRRESWPRWATHVVRLGNGHAIPAAVSASKASLQASIHVYIWRRNLVPCSGTTMHLWRSSKYASQLFARSSSPRLDVPSTKKAPVIGLTALEPFTWQLPCSGCHHPASHDRERKWSSVEHLFWAPLKCW